MKIGCIIQANRFAWDGSQDNSIKKLDGKYVIEYTIEKIKQLQSIKNNIVIAVGNTEENKIFEEIASKHNIKCYLGSQDNVLERFENASKLLECDVIVKTLGQNCFVDCKLIEEMINEIFNDKEIEFIQPPDEFETSFSAEIFKVQTLEKIRKNIASFDKDVYIKYLARPISFVKCNKKLFEYKIYEYTPNYTNEYLINIREKSKQIFMEEQVTLNKKYIVDSGNFYMERYKFASQFIKNNCKVLDIACGSGYGSKYIYDNITKDVIGADLDTAIIKDNNSNYESIKFYNEDATKTSYNKEFFDVVLSMETIEHIPLNLVENYILEMKRILKQGGSFICTTPQNNNGNIPVNPWHVKEYSLEEFKEILSKHFKIEKIYGAKNGIYGEDEKGSSMMAICRK